MAPRSKADRELDTDTTFSNHVDMAVVAHRNSSNFNVPSTSLAELLPRDRVIELSGHVMSARTTAAVALVIQAQARGEPVAWIQPEGGSLFPPDLAASGVDLDALIVVHVPPHGVTREGHALP